MTLNFPARSWRSLLLAMLASFVIAGCGDSEDFVITGNNNNNNNPSQTGSLSFNFVTPQGTITAPTGTTEIRFDLYDGPNGTGALVDSRTRPFAARITLESVPIAVESTVLTFYNASGIPVQQTVVSTPVSPGQNVDVNPNGSQASTPGFESLVVTPATLELALNGTANLSVVASFDSGDNVNLTGNTAAGLTYVSSPAGVVSVSNAGVVSALAPGNTTITVSLTTNGETRTDTVAVQVDEGVPPGPGPLDRLEVTPSDVTLLINDTATLTFQGFDADDEPVAVDPDELTATSADPAVASVSNTTGSFVIEANGAGNTTITIALATDSSINTTVDVTVLSSSNTNFETFSNGSVNGQGG